MTTLVWFRADLRADGNPALDAACGEEMPVVALFLLAEAQWREHDWSDARIDLVRRSVDALGGRLGALGIPLLVHSAPRFADAPAAILEVARAHDAAALHFNRELELNEQRRDDAVRDALSGAGVHVRTFDDQVLVPPESMRTGADRPYAVFTPFRKRWTSLVRAMLPLERSVEPTSRGPAVPYAPIQPVPGASKGHAAGATAAQAALDAFLRERIEDYESNRDRADLDGTSRLSPALAVGALGLRTCVAAAIDANAAHGGDLDGGHPGIDTWISELAWREFYRHVVAGCPRVCMGRAYQPATERVAWRNDEDDFAAWTQGRTGYPIVDAAMRCLLETAWMHNRLRMITAMFLSKHLLIDWRRGERHFMRHLVDGDLASNNGGWQWAASTGTDAAPYFRVFNPWTQSAKADPDGSFIRTWVPELRDVPTRSLHTEPASGAVAPGYPAPIVDHKLGRQRAIDAFKRLRSADAMPGGR